MSMAPLNYFVYLYDANCMTTSDDNRIMFVPSFILWVSLSRKKNEIRLAANKIELENAIFTETWLKQGIPDSVVNIARCNITLQE